MKLLIQNVQNSNHPDGEFIILRALDNINLKDYAIIDKTFESDGSISNEFRHIFFFPDKKLKAGDWAALCSGIGTNGTKLKFDDGDEFYCYYWQSRTCVWNDKGGDTAIANS